MFFCQVATVATVPQSVCLCFTVCGRSLNTRVTFSDNKAAEIGERKQENGLTLTNYIKELIQENVMGYSKCIIDIQ